MIEEMHFHYPGCEHSLKGIQGPFLDPNLEHSYFLLTVPEGVKDTSAYKIYINENTGKIFIKLSDHASEFLKGSFASKYMEKEGIQFFWQSNFDRLYLDLDWLEKEEFVTKNLPALREKAQEQIEKLKAMNKDK